MLVNFFHVLKDTGVPVTPRELLDLLEAMEQRLAFGDMDDFYSLSRAILVKDEKYYDRFDRAFGLHFQDLEALDDVIEAMIPDDWLRSEFMKQLSDEDKANGVSFARIAPQPMAVILRTAHVENARRGVAVGTLDARTFVEVHEQVCGEAGPDGAPPGYGEASDF